MLVSCKSLSRLKVSVLCAATLLFGTISPVAAEPPSTLHWIVSQSSLNRLSTVMSAADLYALFDNPNTYVITNVRAQTLNLTHAKHVRFYRNETEMASDLRAGKLSGMDGVLYDNEAYKEAGNTTPEEQKNNPLPYVQDAATLLHAAHKIFVYTIGAAVGPKGEFWNKTLPSVAPYPDVIDFQTQAAEGTPRFAAQVQHYSSVYRRFGGDHIMLVGIAVSPKGRAKSASEIRSAYDEALKNRPPVDGFWLNMAVKSKSCTGCAASLDVAPGVQFLQSILRG